MNSGVIDSGRVARPARPWPMVRLGDVCEVASGNSAPQNKNLYTRGSFPFVRTSDVGAIHFGVLKTTRDFLNEDGIKGLKLFRKGSILFPKSGASIFLNHRVILGFDSFVVSHLAVINPLNNLLSPFLLYCLSNIDARDLMQDCNYPALRTSEIENIPIPLPPLSVQREIVGRLEKELGKADELAAKSKRLGALAEELFKSELDAAFKNVKGEKVRLGDVCETCSGGTPLKSRREYYDGGKIPWLRSGEVCRMNIDKTELSITKKGVECSSAKMVPANSVAVAMYGATAGQVGILRISLTTNQAICVILPNEKYLPEFLYYHLVDLKDVIVDGAQGDAQPNSSQIKIKNLTISLPSLSVQREIVARLDAARERSEKLKAAAERGAALAAELRKSILQEAFA